MPPATGPSPSDHMVAGEIDPSVRPAPADPGYPGVEVHPANLRQMSNGRLFLDVNAVGLRACMGMPRSFLKRGRRIRDCRGPAPCPGRA